MEVFTDILDNIFVGKNINRVDKRTLNQSRDSKGKQQSEETVKTKKELISPYRIISTELCKKNILIVNKTLKTNIKCLSEVLDTLGERTAMFENTLDIVTCKDSKNDFKKMLLENPQLYFSNLNVNTTTSNFDRSTKGMQRILVVNFDYVDDMMEIEGYFNQNTCIIMLSTNYNCRTSDLYRNMNDYKPTILINKKDNTKLLQQKLYSKILINVIMKDVELDKYIDFINNTTIKNILVKSGEIRYS